MRPRSWLILLVVLTGLIGHLAWGFVMGSIEAKEKRAGTLTEALDLVKAVAVPCAVPLATRELGQLDSTLAAFVQESEWGDLDLLELGIVDAEGLVAAHTDPSRFGQRAPEPFVVRALAASTPVSELYREGDEPRLRVSIPIESGLRWGTATAVISLARVEDGIRRSRVDSVLRSLVGASFLGVVLTALTAALGPRRLPPPTPVAMRLESSGIDSSERVLANAFEIAVGGPSPSCSVPDWPSWIPAEITEEEIAELDWSELVQQPLPATATSSFWRESSGS